MLVYNKFAFYHIPRTGGNSIEHVLNFCDKLPQPGWMRLGDVHAPLCEQPIDVKEYEIYTNIRNPFHRLVSLYELIRAGRSHFINWDKPVSFKEFIYDHWGVGLDNHMNYHTQEEHLFVEGKLPENVTLVKMEEMNQRWPQILRDYFKLHDAGPRVIKIPHRNSVAHGDPMTYYDEDLIKFTTKREEWVLQFYENPTLLKKGA